MEILVVVAIIGILVSIVAVNIGHKPSEARVDATRMDLRALQAALQMFKAEAGSFPTQEQGLDALIRKPARPPLPDPYPAGGYLQSVRLPRDAWGQPFIYLAPGRHSEPYEIISYGSDRAPGGTGYAEDLSTSDL